MKEHLERIEDGTPAAAQRERAARAFSVHRSLRDALAIELERMSRETGRALRNSIGFRFLAIRQRERASVARLLNARKDRSDHEGTDREREPQDAGR
jgi:hypothetical protein